MINRLRLQNFKCLLDVDVSLGPFTILIGPNDSGKSSLFQAIQLLADLSRFSWPHVFAGPLSLENLVWRKDTTRAISWNVEGLTQNRSFEYEISLTAGMPFPGAEGFTIDNQLVFRKGAASDQLAVSGYQSNPFRYAAWRTAIGALSEQKFGPASSVVQSLSSTAQYSFNAKSLRNDAVPAKSPSLSPSGDNLVAVLDAILSGPDRASANNLEKVLSEEIPSLAGIALPVADNPPAKSLEFSLARNGTSPITIPARLASDGAVLLTAFLALAYGNTPELICIEEPENGLHYSRLKLIIDLLRKISKGEVGNRARQVIVATHSPLLLNFARPEEVRIFKRSPDGSTRIVSMETVPNISKYLEEFATGELWYLLGEEALIKGQQP